MLTLPGKGATSGGKRRLVRAAAAATLASSALMLVNGPASVAMPMQDHADTKVVALASATVPAQPPYKQLALGTLDQVVKGDFAAVSARFDESIRQEGNPEVLAKAWKSYQEDFGFGRYQSHGDPQQIVSGNRIVVDVPLRMVKQPGDFRVAFDKDGHIVGLWFLRTGVPVP